MMTAVTTTATSAEREHVVSLFAAAGITVPPEEIETFVELARTQRSAIGTLVALQPEVATLDWAMVFSPLG